MNSVSDILRTSLLRISIPETRINTVEIQQITLQPGQMGGLHFHPCPVTGYILEGTGIMQVEGEAELNLNKGDAFYEPQNRRITKFGNYSESHVMTFIAVYLFQGDQELIKML